MKEKGNREDKKRNKLIKVWNKERMLQYNREENVGRRKDSAREVGTKGKEKVEVDSWKITSLMIEAVSSSTASFHYTSSLCTFYLKNLAEDSPQNVDNDKSNLMFCSVFWYERKLNICFVAVNREIKGSYLQKWFLSRIWLTIMDLQTSGVSPRPGKWVKVALSSLLTLMVRWIDYSKKEEKERIYTYTYIAS